MKTQSASSKNISTLLIFSLGLSLGILFFVYPQTLLLYWGVGLTILLFIFFSSERKKLLFVVFFLSVLFFGYAYIQLRTKKPSEVLLSKLNQEISLTGSVDTNPETKKGYSTFILKTEYGKIRVSIFSNEIPSYGDTLSVKGVVSEPENFLTETGKIFDYKHYLSKDTVFFLFSGSSMVILKQPTFSFKRWLYSVFNQANKLIEKYMRFPESSLARGVLLGDDTQIPTEIKNAYIKTGTIHVVALSGYNISVLLTWVLLIARRFLIYKWGTIIGLISVLFFVIGTGGSQTAIRAGIMGSLALVANYYGRSQDAIRLLLLTYIGMLLLNPYILPYDVSFHLSFLATFGIIGFQNKFESYFSFLPSTIRELLATTLSAQLLVLPYLIAVFGQLSVISIPVNVLIAPLIPILMFTTMGVVFTGALFSPLGTFIGMFATKIAWVLTKIITLFSNFSFSYLVVPQFSIFIVIGCYFFILVWYLREDHKKILI